MDAVALSPDGRTYVTAQRLGRRYVLRLHSTTGDRTPRALPPLPLPVSRDPAEPVVPQDTMPLLAFSPDGTALAYGVSAPGRSATAQPVRIWDLRRGRVATTLDLPGDALVGIALGPAGRTLQTARSSLAAVLTGEIWDTATHRTTATLPPGTGAHLAVRPDGRLLVADNRTVSLPSARSTMIDLVRGGTRRDLRPGLHGDVPGVQHDRLRHPGERRRSSTRRPSGRPGDQHRRRVVDERPLQHLPLHGPALRADPLAGRMSHARGEAALEAFEGGPLTWCRAARVS
ncbi:hypothetical protein QFZ66_008299 [Streptomyces sp. B4I13]|uniref:WD40 repeat domain-containing protein n=1 Tax=Streptomyces sp. B4I13 TaxID=3042271 RepID=UPI00277F2247|nr:hypothetical protein [Streptomyces sp. B4I13]MDQ0964421.1 hypothetical protein [Streptomyces sp. B4I13]